MMRILLCFFIVSFCFAQSEETQGEETSSLAPTSVDIVEEHLDIKYDTIRDVLKNDGLTEEEIKQREKSKVVKKKVVKIRKDRYDYPTKQRYLRFISEYWLVKNNSNLAWDFEKPEYGIELKLKEIFEKLGVYNYKFQLLILNTPLVPHLALPVGNNEGIYLLSLPFMRSLDLSKTEICLLLIEDYLRLKEKIIEKKFTQHNLWGANFYKKEIDNSFVAKDIEVINKIVFDTGFNFQEQYTITIGMQKILSSDEDLYAKYLLLIDKIKSAIESNPSFSKYIQMYPSPELQQKWLKK